MLRSSFHHLLLSPSPSLAFSTWIQLESSTWNFNLSFQLESYMLGIFPNIGSPEIAGGIVGIPGFPTNGFGFILRLYTFKLNSSWRIQDEFKLKSYSWDWNRQQIRERWDEVEWILTSNPSISSWVFKLNFKLSFKLSFQERTWDTSAAFGINGVGVGNVGRPIAATADSSWNQVEMFLKIKRFSTWFFNLIFSSIFKLKI